MLHLHLLTADPSRVVAINARSPLTNVDLQNLDAIGVNGRGYGPARLRFRGLGLPYTSQIATFPAATADWPQVTHWVAIRHVSASMFGPGPTLTCMGYGPLSNPLVVSRGEQAEVVAAALHQLGGGLIVAPRPPFVGILATTQQLMQQQQQLQNQAPIAAMVTPPVPAQQAHTWVSLGPSSAPPDSVPVKEMWVTPRCECGAEKTWGPGAGGHSDWCPKASRR